MPICGGHDARDEIDVAVGYALLKKIAHRIYENKFRRTPKKWINKLFGDEAKIEPLLVGMSLHATEALGEGFGIAVLAAGTDLDAAAYWVPGGIGPFDMGALAQLVSFDVHSRHGLISIKAACRRNITDSDTGNDETELIRLYGNIRSLFAMPIIAPPINGSHILDNVTRLQYQVKSSVLLWKENLKVTLQDEFGGAWTQQKLEALGKYLKAYTTIFKKNPRARFYSITYVDAFAGTGTLRTRPLGGLADLIPGMREAERHFRKGSVRRALEVEPPFDEYIFIEKNTRKCDELRKIAAEAPSRNVKIVNEDANIALLKWCNQLKPRTQRAVAFLDPFGASVGWEAIAALGKTKAVDLWVLFPYFAINRMLVRDRKPQESWKKKLTFVFGTPNWEEAFYAKTTFRSLFDSVPPVEGVRKSADHREITDFFVDRLKTEFVAVSKPLPLHNSTGSLLFILFFAAGNEKSGKTGLKIANSIIDF
jgi:three-Cys-motif partner protein